MNFKPIKYRAHNNYDTAEASDAAIPHPEGYGPSLTIQSMTEEADLNVMMARYGVTGKFPDNPRMPSYGDFTGITDFRTALEAIGQAEDAFMQYPAQFRARFENNPQLFLEWTANEANRPEMEKLGLLKTPPAPPAGPTPAGATPNSQPAPTGAPTVANAG